MRPHFQSKERESIIYLDFNYCRKKGKKTISDTEESFSEEMSEFTDQMICN